MLQAQALWDCNIQDCCLCLTHSGGKTPKSGPSGDSFQAVSFVHECGPCQAEGDFFFFPLMEMTFFFFSLFPLSSDDSG